MSRKLIPLIDSDILVYRCGFAAKGEPLNYVLHTVKQSIENIYQAFNEAPEAKVYLTGKGNYRDKVAVTKPYKGNRDPNNKPDYYDEIRQYLIDQHQAQVIDRMEADDALGIHQWKNKDKSTVIVSIDKDLRCIPGWHYNFVKQELEYVPLAQANKNFWTQVLTGDATDNIQGIPKCGAKTAAKIIGSTDGSWAEMHCRVYDEYMRYYGREGPDKFKEMATLIWIQREENQNFDGSLIYPEDDDVPW